MNPFEMVIAIVAMAMLTGIIIKAMELRAKKPEGDTEAENRQLRRQLADVQQRMKVLERIVTDSGVQTAAQIEALRDRDRISEEDKA
jgi:5-bromo-4-chloroindolyl phosphate hydrolysis protein